MAEQPLLPHLVITWRRSALAAVLLAGTAFGGYAVGQVSMAAETDGAPVNPPGTTARRTPCPISPTW